MSSLEIPKFQFYCDKCIVSRKCDKPNNDSQQILDYADTNFSAQIYSNICCNDCLNKKKELFGNRYVLTLINIDLSLVQNINWFEKYKIFSFIPGGERSKKLIPYNVYNLQISDNSIIENIVDTYEFLDSLLIDTIIIYNDYESSYELGEIIAEKLSVLQLHLVNIYEYEDVFNRNIVYRISRVNVKRAIK